MVLINLSKLEALLNFLLTCFPYVLEVKDLVAILLCKLLFLSGGSLERYDVFVIVQIFREILFHLAILLDEVLRHSNCL
jgi:hypothetical protein